MRSFIKFYNKNINVASITRATTINCFLYFNKILQILINNLLKAFLKSVGLSHSSHMFLLIVPGIGFWLIVLAPCKINTGTPKDMTSMQELETFDITNPASIINSRNCLSVNLNLESFPTSIYVV